MASNSTTNSSFCAEHFSDIYGTLFGMIFAGMMLGVVTSMCGIATLAKLFEEAQADEKLRVYDVNDLFSSFSFFLLRRESVSRVLTGSLIELWGAVVCLICNTCQIYGSLNLDEYWLYVFFGLSIASSIVDCWHMSPAVSVGASLLILIISVQSANTEIIFVGLILVGSLTALSLMFVLSRPPKNSMILYQQILAIPNSFMIILLQFTPPIMTSSDFLITDMRIPLIIASILYPTAVFVTHIYGTNSFTILYSAVVNLFFIIATTIQSIRVLGSFGCDTGVFLYINPLALGWSSFSLVIIGVVLGALTMDKAQD